MVNDSPVPAWCQPNGWTYHRPTATVFQSVQLQRETDTGIYHLRDCNNGDYLVSECEPLSANHLKQAAVLVTWEGLNHLVPHPRGVLLPAKNLLITIPDECDRAAQSLAQFFNGQITLTEKL